MAKLTALGALPGGLQAGDRVYVVRGDGGSPETFTSYQADADALLAYDFGFAFGDTPDAGSVIQRVRIGRDIVIPGDMGGFGGVEINPDATWVVDVQDDGVSIGTISVSTGGVATFATNTGSPPEPVNVAAGSEITFVAPSASPPEASVAGGSFIIVATQA